jgi:ABC-type molybdenum transport system ATPase subunit/photorepair protein PhrA
LFASVGLDPHIMSHISSLLQRLAEQSSPRIFVSLRPQDIIPEWITHLIYATENAVVKCQGRKEDVFDYLREQYRLADTLPTRIRSALEQEIEAEDAPAEGTQAELDPDLSEMREVGRHLASRGSIQYPDSSSQGLSMSRDGFPAIDEASVNPGEPLVEMAGVRIAYGNNAVLGNWTQQDSPSPGLHWTVRRGERWGIFGANGSGKTTLLSLITSDHPQTYSAPVRIFGRSRLPEAGKPGISIFDLQKRIGHASPEIHALFPKSLSVRKALQSAWADTPISKPRMDSQKEGKVEACLTWFEAELNPKFQESHALSNNSKWADDIIFGELSFSAQRVLLFLKAFIHSPDILILDEAFSGMDDVARDKCILFLSRGESMELSFDAISGNPIPTISARAKEDKVQVLGLTNRQAVLCVSHTREDVPGCMREWVCLKESGKGAPRFGRLQGPLECNHTRWQTIWSG